MKLLTSTKGMEMAINLSKKGKKNLAKEIIEPKKVGNYNICLKSFVYHINPDLYDTLAGDRNPKASPIKGAHKRQAQYDGVVMNVINTHFGLARTVDNIVVR